MVIILELSRPIVWLVRHVCSDEAEFFFLQKKTTFWPFLDRYLDHTLISLNGMGRGVVRILQSLEEVIRSIYHRRTKVLLPHPLPQVMNNDQPPLSYLFICFCYSFILFIYLFIFLITFFFTKGEYQKELFYLTYLGSVPINLCLAFIWMRFGILLYREVRKKFERRVGHMWGTRRTAV